MSDDLLEPQPFTFARIEGGVVMNLELWVEPPEVEGVVYVASDEAQLGDLYDPEADAFAAPAPDLDKLKAGLIAQVDQIRDQRIAGGFLFDGHTIQSRATDRENITALGVDANEAIAAGKLAGDYLWHPQFPAGFGFITADNQVIPLDCFQMKALRARGVEFKAGLTFHARGLKDEVLAAATIAELQAIDIWEGWPQ